MRKVILSVFMVLVMASGLLAQTWTKQTIPVTTDLNSCSAVSATVCWAVGPASVIIKTTNGGTTWTSAVGNLPAATDLYTCSATSDLNCWVGAGDGSLYNTTNGGTTWTFYTLPAPATAFVDVVHFFNQQIGFVLGDPVGGVWCYYWTTNAGANWTSGPSPVATGTEAGWNNSYCAIDTAHIWFGTNVNKIYKGSLRGGFTSAATTVLDSYGVAFFDNNNGSAIMTTGTAASPNTNSTNGGTSWAASTFTPVGIPFGIKAIANNFYGYGWMCTGGSATTAGKMYRTTNKGTSWTEQTTALAVAKSFYALSMFNVNCGWAVTGAAVTGGTNDGVWKYTDALNGVNPVNTTTPTNFVLDQNYPNPFNPSTTINYSIPKSSFVTLKVYDVLGNEVKTLVNEQQSVNNYSITADFSNLTTGVYYYTLKAGDFTSTKKLMLIK
ncbi:MAG: T9SS type A sorting domain-containing protein [Ignavibacteriota bacterium]|nr:T9SS type A sorting domain-containing protein [Ignavibacteriota bacterium]